MPTIVNTSISEEMKSAYIDYAMSVIVSRALPDIRDGLKPVQRRIIYAMHEQGHFHAKSFVKCAAVVGEVLKKYHPHGDVATYEALVRMGQNFSLRYPLIDPQGNYGSIDGDPAAAMRYTETRLSAIAEELLKDIEKRTVNFSANYSGEYQEPDVLPSRLPNLILNGVSGIAVGMATQIPPHNLKETAEALSFLLKNPAPEVLEAKAEDQNIRTMSIEPEHEYLPREKPVSFLPFTSDQPFEKLLTYIRGPDFPTGGVIFKDAGLLSVYASGKGKIIVSGKAEIEETKGGRFRIVITEIPYQVNKANLVAKIADLVRDKKITDIADLRDESDRKGLTVVVELKRQAAPKKVLNQLYKHTELRTAFNANLVALVNGQPQTVTLKKILEEFISHRQAIIVRRGLFELSRARAREHILQGLKIALDNLDAVIETIKKSQTSQEAKNNLINKFNLTPPQAEAILEMKLRQLAALERQKIEDELKDVLANIVDIEQLIYSPQNVLNKIDEEIIELKEKYGDARRTKVIAQEGSDFNEEDLIANEQVIIAVTQSGYIKRMKGGAFKSQQRGGKGVIGMKTKENDSLARLMPSQTHDNLLFFTNLGRAYKLKVWEVPPGTRLSRGKAIVNLLDLDREEKVEAILNYASDKTGKTDQQFVFMATIKGYVKKTRLSDFDNIRKNGIIALTLNKGDSLAWVKLTSGEDKIILVTSLGKSILFSEKDIRSTGRSSRGVRGIKLLKDNLVIRADVVAGEGRDFYVLVVTEKGLGKITPLDQYPRQKRGGIGVKTASLTPKTGKIKSAQIVDAKNWKSLVLTSKKGQVVKLPAAEVPKLTRLTQGVILMRFANQADSLAAAACL